VQWSKRLGSAPANGVYTGPWVPADSSDAFLAMKDAVQNGTLYLDCSEDYGKTTAVTVNVAGAGLRRTAQVPQGRYNALRVRYVNGVTADVGPILVSIASAVIEGDVISVNGMTGVVVIPGTDVPDDWTVTEPDQFDGATSSLRLNDADPQLNLALAGPSVGYALMYVNALLARARLEMQAETGQVTPLVLIQRETGFALLTLSHNGAFVVHDTQEDGSGSAGEAITLDASGAGGTIEVIDPQGAGGGVFIAGRSDKAQVQIAALPAQIDPPFEVLNDLFERVMYATGGWYFQIGRGYGAIGEGGIYLYADPAAFVQSTIAGAVGQAQATLELRNAEENNRLSFFSSDDRSSIVISLGVGQVLPQIAANAWALDATGSMTMDEQADPAAPAANKGTLFMRDNGAGKTQFCARFPTGAVVVIATEP
jgi:hypothetical protein